MLGAIRSGARAEITTPTGKEWEVYYECSEFIILESTGYTVSGREARERLKEVLRSTGTECKLYTASEQGGSA